MKKYFFILFCLFAISFFNTANAGTTGKLMGRVTDIETGDPIPGVNIIILEKKIGAACDVNGRYMIINIPPGLYSVKASLMGYQSVTKTDVKINLDLTTTLNFELRQTDTEIEGITVKAKKKLVETDITGTEKIVTAEEMENMAVENIQEVVAVTAGAVGSGQNLHIRGGRSNEVVYTIDGMSVSNPVDNGFGMQLDMDAVGDMNISTGGFTAEFGNAQSAIINLVTKSGGPDYFGKFQWRSDHLIIGGSNYDELKFNIGGPLIPTGSRSQRDKYTFFANVTGSWSDGRYRDYYHIDKNDVLYKWIRELNPNTIKTINELGTDRDTIGFIELGDRFNNSYQANAKMKFQLTPKTKFTIATRGDRSVWIPYSHLMKYSLNYYNHWEETHDQQAFTYDHTLSPKLFYKIRGSRFATGLHLDSGVDRDWYFTEANTDWDQYWRMDPAQNNFGVETPGQNPDQIVYYPDQYGTDKQIPLFSMPGTNAGDFWDDKTVTYTLKGDLTYQVNQIHSAKTGIEIKYNEISKDRIYDPWVIDDVKRLPKYLEGKDVDTTGMGIDPNNLPDTLLAYGKNIYPVDVFKDAIKFAGGDIDGYKAYPWQGAYYIQDKMEWEGMIVNAGLRFDFWYLGDEYKVKSDSTGEYVDADWAYIQYIKDIGRNNFVLVKEKVDKFQLMVSPRLGVSHPITEKDVLHFAYNYQSQLPPMQYVFTSATPRVGETGTNVGNPNLKPETTITYEVGVEHQMGEDYTLDVTLFYKNIYNLVSRMSNDYATLPDSIAQAGRQYFLYISDDYGSARGAEFTFRKIFSNFWGFHLGYTYSWANGRNSGAHDARDNLREFPLNWDVRHIASLRVNWGIPEDEEFYLFGLKLPDKLHTTFRYQLFSGEPYTPITPDPENDEELDTNSDRKPWTHTADLQIRKSFNLFSKSEISFILDIENVFNTRNVNYVNAKTGKTPDKGTYDYWEEYDLNHDGKITAPNEDVTGAAIYLAGLSNPNIYSAPRKITLGFSFKW